MSPGPASDAQRPGRVPPRRLQRPRPSTRCARSSTTTRRGSTTSTDDADPDRSAAPATPTTGPLAGIRVTDFCWMVVGALATRLLADFGAEVIRIEDRNRLDMPRRLPLYKGEAARGPTARRTPTPIPNKGGMFNNCNRNKLGVTLNMRDRKRARARRAADRREQRGDGELRPGRDGAVGAHRRARARAAPGRDLRPDERVRPQRPLRRLPQLRPGRPGRVRPLAHQRAARAGAVRLGAVVHGQPGRVLQLGGADDGDPAPATPPASAPTSTSPPSRRASSCSGRSCSTSRSTGGAPAAPTSRPATASSIPRAAPHGVYPCRGRGPLGGDRRVRRRRVGGVRRGASARPPWTADETFSHAGGRARQPGRARRARRGVDRRAGPPRA